MKKRGLVCGFVLVGLSAVQAPRALGVTVSQSFDAGGGGTFTTDFTQSGTNAGNFFQNTTGGGINNTNAVDLTSNAGDSTAIFRNAVFNLSTGTPTVTVSGYFRNQTGVTGGNAAGIFQLGFGSDAGNGTNNTGTAFQGAFNSPASDALDNFLTARVRGDGAIEFQTGVNNVTTNLSTSGATALVNNSIYFLTASFTRTGTANTFSGTASLFNADATTGATVGGALLSISNPAITAAPIYTDATTFAGFRAAGSSGSGVNGANLVDNFSATDVPEPVVASAAAVGLLGAALRRRRRV